MMSWRSAKVEKSLKLKPVYIAICIGILAILIASITKPEIMVDGALAYISIMSGLVVALRRVGQEEMSITIDPLIRNDRGDHSGNKDRTRLLNNISN